MPIPVTCKCGTSFAAGDHLAGKRVKCPKCASPIAIPNPADEEEGDDYSLAAAEPVAKKTVSIFDDAGISGGGLKAGETRCPTCSEPMPETAVLCIHCGFNKKLGKQVESKVKKKSGSVEGEAADFALERAAQRIEEDREAKESEEGEGMSVWVIAGALAFALGFIGLMLWLPGEKAFLYGGYIIASCGWIMSLVYVIFVLKAAFADNVLHGVMVLFVPFYFFIYIVMRWERQGANLIMWGIGVVIQLAGLGMILAAPLLKPTEDVDSRRPQPAAVAAIHAAANPQE